MVASPEGAGGNLSPRITGILAIVAIALGLFVYVNEIEGDMDRRAAADEAAKIHSGFDATAIDSVSLVTLDGVSATFERRNGRWWVTSPVEARAEATALDAIASALADMPREGTVGESADLSGFGLGASATVVRFQVGGDEHGLRIGRSTPVGGHRYVARLGDGDVAGNAGNAEVAYVASYRVNAFNRNLNDLRDRRLFSVESARVRRLRIAWPQGGTGAESSGEPFVVDLARGEDGAWWVAAPIRAQADESMIRELLSNLIYLRASGFVDERTPAAAAALLQTEIEFDWTLDPEDPAEAIGLTATGTESALEGRVRIGGLVSGGRIIEGPEGRWATIAAERLDDFPKDLERYRFKRLAEFDLASARRLEFSFAAPVENEGRVPLRVVATLEEAGWSSADRLLDRDAISELVRLLSSLDADGIVAEEMGPKELGGMGLSPPRARINVEGGADAGGPVVTLADLRFGRIDSGGRLLVQRGDRPQVFRLSAASAAGLPVSESAYLEYFEVDVSTDGADEVAEGEDASEPLDVDPLDGLDLGEG